MLSIIMVLVLLTAGYKAQIYDNSPNGILYRICQDNQVVSMIKSFYDNNAKDRLWKIECKDFVQLSNCQWFSFNNLHVQELQFNCPADNLVTGIYSGFDSLHEDRMWAYRCCGADLTTFEFRETSKVNYYAEDFTWHVPGENFLKGINTHGRNNDGDHRWSFTYSRAVIINSEIAPSPILIAHSQRQHTLTEGDIAVHSRDKRSTINCPDCLWSNADGQVEIPYKISSDFSRSEKTIIETAIEEFDLSTCIRFVPQNNQKDYIDIVKKEGCWSVIGRKGGIQEMSLGYGCVSNGIVQHELMHALGFWHEQSRSDRDIYVKIKYENINAMYVPNFELKESENLNVPYDYSSLMHYGRKDFSKNGEDTVVPFVTTASIGQMIQMSDDDILKINKLYGCKNYLHKNGEWDSELEQTFTRQCPEGQAVSGFTSAYNSQKKDRHWGVTCKAFKITRDCHWSEYVNDHWEDIAFECGDDRVLAGVHSIHSHTMQDRKWKFSCCKASFSLFNLKHTPLVNNYGEYFSWKVASANYITAVKSTFDTLTRDRRWSFSYQQINVD